MKQPSEKAIADYVELQNRIHDNVSIVTSTQGYAVYNTMSPLFGRGLLSKTCTDPECLLFVDSATDLFLYKYAGLFYIDPLEGYRLKSLLFTINLPDDNIFKPLADAVIKKISNELVLFNENGRTFTVFKTVHDTLGDKTTVNELTSSYLKPLHVNIDRISSTHDVSAVAAYQNNKIDNLKDLLDDFSKETVEKSLDLIKNGKLVDPCVTPALEWILDTHNQLNKDTRTNNAFIVHRSNVTPISVHMPYVSPAFCDVLDFVKNEREDYDVFNELLTTKYANPKTTSFNPESVEKTEKFLTDNGYVDSLARRHCNGDDVVRTWVSQDMSPGFSVSLNSGLVSEHITVERFLTEVIDGCSDIWFIPNEGAYYPLGGLTTQVDPNSKSLFAWDSPLAAYMYAYGCICQRFNLEPARSYKVTFACPLPHLTGPSGSTLELTNSFGGGAFLCIEKCVDKLRTVTLSIVKDMLKEELLPYADHIVDYAENTMMDDTPRLTQGLLLNTLDSQSSIDLVVMSHKGEYIHYIVKNTL